MENGEVAVLFQVKAINPFVISPPVAIGGNFAQDAQVVAFKSWNFKPTVSWVCVEFVGIHFLFVLFVFCRFKDCRFPCLYLVVPSIVWMHRVAFVIPHALWGKDYLLVGTETREADQAALLHHPQGVVCQLVNCLDRHFVWFGLVGLIPYFTIPHDFGNASSFFIFWGKI